MAPFEALLLRNTGINLAGNAGVLWYLSALIITMPIILYVAKRFNSIFQHYLVWILPLFLYGFIIHEIGTVRTTDWILSNLRAIAGMTLGGSICFLTQPFTKIKVSNILRSVLTCVEIGSFLVAIYFCTFASFSKTYCDIFFIFLMYISLSITFSGLSWTSNLHGSIFSFLGKISLPIYCIHFTVFRAINFLLPGISVTSELFIVTFTTILVASIMYLFINRIISPQINKLVTAIKICCTNNNS